MSDEEEWQPGDEEEEDDATAQLLGDRGVTNSGSAVLRRSSRNVGQQRDGQQRKPDYVSEKHDQTFVGRKGYTHFGRTKLGGDCRPNGKPVQVPKHKHVTMLNFFSAAGKQPLPLPQKTIDLTRTAKTPSPPKKTRTKWGRPTGKTQHAKVQAMKSRAASSKTASALAVPPQKRKKWNGTVCTRSIV